MDAASECAPLNTSQPVIAAQPPLRIAFVITGLDVGGAEMMLWKLLSRIDRTRFAPSVIALSGTATTMLPAFRQLGIPCELLGWRGTGRDAIGGLQRLYRALRRREPDLVQGWMYHGNIAATLAAACAGLKVPVLWNVRATLMEPRHEKRLTAFLIWLSGRLSFSAARIINNSAASAAEHERRRGYLPGKRVILPNGFDTDKFKPCAAARAALRKALHVDHDTLLVGHVARYHPMKDHDNFVQAAACVARAHAQTHFVMAGEGVDVSNRELMRLVAAYGLEDRIHLVGPQDDVRQITAALDIQVSSSSSGEAFPNVVGEAMSCGVPCVVTDVGDSAAVVGDSGVTVPPRDPQALADGISRLIVLGAAGRADLGARARQRTIDHFSLDAVVRQYEALYMQVYRERRSN